MALTFYSRHWPLQAYVAAIASAGLVVEALREVTVDEASMRQLEDQARWRRIPFFLDLRARKR